MNFVILKTINVIVLLSLFVNCILCEIKVNARCGRPGLPPQSTLYLITPERSRFENNEKVIFVCKKNEFPNHQQTLECQNGTWSGPTPRCGQHIDAQVIHLEIIDCKSSDSRRLLSQSINQSLDGPIDQPPLRPNSFHSMRVPLDLSISANESSCYTWNIRLDRKVQIWFLLIDIWFPLTNSTQEEYMPTLSPFVGKHRTCTLQKTHRQVIDSDIVMGYYYYCDLNNQSNPNRDVADMLDTITVHINSSVEVEIGLEAVFIGDIYTTKIGAKLVKPDCGQFRVQNIGVDFQPETGHTFIGCNDSFTDETGNRALMRNLNKAGNPKHKFICNSNGQWVGEWPICVPKLSCAKEEIIDDKDSSVDIEEIGNVYYVNQSQWYAINDSWIRYACNQENDIMVGKSVTMCMKNGQWSNKMPYCTGAASEIPICNPVQYTYCTILIVFVLIVFFVFRTHSKRVKKELRETRNEIREESVRRRISEECYAGFSGDNFYDNTDNFESCGRKSVLYETVDYETVSDPPRYQTRPVVNTNLMPEYLDMLPGTIK